MKKEDESIEIDECFGSATQIVSKPFYNELVANPNMTVEQFKELVDEKFHEKGKKDNKIITIRQAGLYKNKFILYKPIFKSEEITIEY